MYLGPSLLFCPHVLMSGVLAQGVGMRGAMTQQQYQQQQQQQGGYSTSAQQQHGMATAAGGAGGQRQAWAGRSAVILISNLAEQVPFANPTICLAFMASRSFASPTG